MESPQSEFKSSTRLNLRHNSPSIERMNTQFFGGPITRTVKALIVVNVVVFLLQIFSYLARSLFVMEYFSLVPEYITSDFRIWQFVSYMFLHSISPPFFHILFNMLMLFMFGNELERYWGSRRFLTYYFITGIGAGFSSWLVSPHSIVPIIGASGAIYGLLLAYGLIYPNRVILLGFLFPIKAKWLVLFMGAIAFLSSLTDPNAGIAHVAHLGGMVFGYLFLKGKGWMGKYQYYNKQRQHEQLKKQFELYYGDVRRKIEQDKKKGPTIH